MITYDKLWSLCGARGITTYTLRETYHISPALIGKIRSGGTITTGTIDKLCGILGCQPGDIMEYKREDA